MQPHVNHVFLVEYVRLTILRLTKIWSLSSRLGVLDLACELASRVDIETVVRAIFLIPVDN